MLVFFLGSYRGTFQNYKADLDTVGSLEKQTMSSNASLNFNSRLPKYWQSFPLADGLVFCLEHTLSGAHSHVKVDVRLINRGIVHPRDHPVMSLLFGTDDGHRQLATLDRVRPFAHPEQKQRNQQSSAHATITSITRQKEAPVLDRRL